LFELILIYSKTKYLEIESVAFYKNKLFKFSFLRCVTLTADNLDAREIFGSPNY